MEKRDCTEEKKMVVMIHGFQFNKCGTKRVINKILYPKKKNINKYL